MNIFQQAISLYFCKIDFRKICNKLLIIKIYRLIYSLYGPDDIHIIILINDLRKTTSRPAKFSPAQKLILNIMNQTTYRKISQRTKRP